MFTILVIGAHLDECEFGVGGLSCKFTKLGHKVVFLNTVGVGYDASIFANDKEKQKLFKHQAMEAAEVLGVSKKVILKYPDKCFPGNDFQTISDIAKVIKEVNPEIVFIQWVKDNHHDHVRTAKASLEALTYINRFAGGKSVKLNLKEIYAYETGIKQTAGFEPDFYINITEEIENAFSSYRKFKALGEEPLVEEKRVLSKFRGLQCGFQYAETLKFIGPYAPMNLSLKKIFGEDIKPAGSFLYPWGVRNYLE
mgnify:CR=1 FL=1